MYRRRSEKDIRFIRYIRECIIASKRSSETTNSLTSSQKCPTETEEFYEILGTCVCINCGYLLSVPPVINIEKKSYTCGRCQSSGGLIRNYLFEEVAQFLYFPCSYTPCSKKIPWHQMDRHEENHRSVRCFFHNNSECLKEIPLQKIGEHFTEYHEDSILTVDNTVKMNYNDSYSIILVPWEDEYFLVYIIHGIGIGILATRRHTNYSKLKLLFASKINYWAPFDDLPVTFYDNFENCNSKKTNNIKDIVIQFKTTLLRVIEDEEFWGLRYYIKLKVDDIDNPDPEQLTKEQNEENKTANEHPDQLTEEENKKDEIVREDPDQLIEEGNEENDTVNEDQEQLIEEEYEEYDIVSEYSDQLTEEENEEGEIVSEDQEQLTEEENEEDKILHNLRLYGRSHPGKDFPQNNLFEVLRNYKCSLCGHLLSVFPVKVAFYNTKKFYKCGRCKPELSSIIYHWQHNKLYEKIACFLDFPCSYSACTQTIPWDMVRDHENNCPHRTIKCPLCNEDILVDDIEEHFKTHYDTIVLKDRLTFNVMELRNVIILFKKWNLYFFVYVLQGRRIAILATRSSEYRKFRLELELLPSDNVGVYFDELPVLLYDVKEHCLRCIYGSCRKSHLANMKGRLPFYERPNASKFTSDLSNNLTRKLFRVKKTLRFRVTFIIDDTKNSDQQVNITEINTEAIRTALTCLYCTSYMTSAIFTCSTGHTMCSRCRPRLQKCPMCTASINGARNYSLEDMSNVVILPCQYDGRGCTCAGKPSALHWHELKCRFTD